MTTITTTTPSTGSFPVELITPERAEALLKFNVKNRKVKENYVTQLAEEMEAGRFAFNGDSIRIAIDNTILDGQHRLLASVKSGRSFQAIIVTGLPPSVMETIDTGAHRSISDHLVIEGHDYATTKAAVARLVLAWRRGLSSSASTKAIPRGEIISFIHSNENLSLRASRVAMKLHLAIGGPVSSYGALYFETFPHGEAFFETLHSGAGMREGDPVLAVRNYMTRNRKLHQIEALDVLVSGWNSYVNGQRRSIIRRSKGNVERPLVPLTPLVSTV